MEQQHFDLSAPMADHDVFHFSNNRPDFNSLSAENGFTHWKARDLMIVLGYQSWAPFNKAIQKAISASITLGIDILDNFVQAEWHENNKIERDYKLSRFACYLVAMNADPKKVEVARAQAYFAATAEAFRRYVQESEDIERLLEREEVTLAEKNLSTTAKAAGVTQYAFFQNAGYRGMYNMNLKHLKQLKNVPQNRSPLDFMGSTELAANRFRITQTQEKLKAEGIKGQEASEKAAESVGKKVRQTMKEISGVTPEKLPASEDIKKVRSSLKSSQKEFARIDKKKP